MNEKISIVVPVYNAEKTIVRCVESLRQQIYPYIEIILVNDGSKDKSLELCQQLKEKDNRIIIINKQNGGVSSARNTGIKSASGKYIMFCDSDDWVMEDYCSYMIEHVEDRHLVMCGFEEISDEQVKFVGKENTDKVEKILKKDFLKYREQGIGRPCNKLFELKIINEYNLTFPEDICLGEDLVFVMKYLKYMSSTIIFLHRKLYIYQNQEAITLSKRAPAVSENEYFYSALSSGIRELSHDDINMLTLCKQIIMQDYEKNFLFINGNSESIGKKYKHIKQAMGTKSFTTCCSEGVQSSNKIYNWLFMKKKAGLLTIYLTIRKRGNQKCEK